LAHVGIVASGAARGTEDGGRRVSA
jgi:hypothetical protein